MGAFDLRTHIYRVQQTGEPVLVKEQPYTRVSVDGHPPVFVRNGQAYWETGDEVTEIPEALRPALVGLVDGVTVPMSVAQAVATADEPPRPTIPSQLWRIERQQRSPYFEPVDDRFSKCLLCEQTFRKKDCGRHLLQAHRELWRKPYGKDRPCD